MGYFDDDSMLRRVHRESVVALSGPRALLMQAAHPVAFAGFFRTTDALDAPYERLHRTALVLDTIGFGSREAADRASRRVRAMHRRVRWTGADGVPRAADDPDLLLWILATLVDSALVVYQKYVGGLTAAERDAYWRDYRQIGLLFGLRDADMPETFADFEAYMAGMLDGDMLQVTPEARDLALRIVFAPPVPLGARPLLELANQITIGLLPADIRRQYGLRWDPARALALHGGAEYVKRVVVPLLPSRLRLVSSARAA